MYANQALTHNLNEFGESPSTECFFGVFLSSLAKVPGQDDPPAHALLAGYEVFVPELRNTLYFFHMPVIVEMHHTGSSPEARAEVVAVIEHALSDRPGDWRVLIIGSQANDQWELKIVGPNAFERSYTLEGSGGQHEPHTIGSIVRKLVPLKRP